MRRLLFRLFLINFATFVITVAAILILRMAGDVRATPVGQAQQAVALMLDLDRPIDEVEARLERLRERFGGGGASLYDRDGRLLGSSHDPPLPFDPAPSDRLPAFDTVDAQGQITGRVVFSPPERLMLTHASIILGLGVTIAGVLALLFAFLATRRLVDPITRMIAASRTIARGEFGHTLGLERRDELGELASAFDHMSRQLSTLQTAQRELLASVSHEFRTPLARMRLVHELLREGDPDQVRDLLPELATDLDELERLVNRVLETARLESEAVGPRELIRPSVLVERTAARFRATHPERELVIELDDEATLGEIEIDTPSLLRALENLLENAYRYAAGDRPIRVGARSEGRRIGIFVADEGPGIAPELRELVFAPFVRGEKSRNKHTGGVGLGLTIVRRIVEAQAGEVELVSELGKGSRFTVWFDRK